MAHDTDAETVSTNPTCTSSHSSRQAAAARLKAGFESQQQEKEAQRIKASQIAAIGAAGGTGSPVTLDLVSEQAKELELENLLIGFEGEVAAGRAETQAELDRLGGQLAIQKSKSAARQANVQFGLQSASFLSGFLPKKKQTLNLNPHGLPAGNAARPDDFR